MGLARLNRSIILCLPADYISGLRGRHCIENERVFSINNVTEKGKNN
jgi:hypothetical protein